MKNLNKEMISFERKEINLSSLPWNEDWFQPQNLVDLTLSFDPKVATLMEETFGTENVNIDNLSVQISLPEDEWLYGFLLSFGNRIKILNPTYIGEIVQQRALEIVKLYKDNEN